jgi:hypothetical protein
MEASGCQRPLGFDAHAASEIGNTAAESLIETFAPNADGGPQDRFIAGR